jgi:hypothetical protein
MPTEFAFSISNPFDVEIVPTAVFTAVTLLVTDCFKLELKESVFEQLQAKMLITAVRINNDFFMVRMFL